MRPFSRSGVSPQIIRRGATGGFTLVELLVVMAIMGILAILAVPAFMSFQNNYNLDATTQGVVAQLNLARQNALASSHPVEVRFYQLADYSNAPPASVFHGATVYRAMQSFLEGDPTVSGGVTSTTFTPITKAYFFPMPVIFVSPAAITTSTGSVDVSNLLTATYSGINPITADVSPSIGDPGNPLPSPYGATLYSYFHFRGNGQTDLSRANSNYYQVTLVMETSASNASNIKLPPNYATLQINVFTGVVTTYRP